VIATHRATFERVKVQKNVDNYEVLVLYLIFLNVISDQFMLLPQWWQYVATVLAEPCLSGGRRLPTALAEIKKTTRHGLHG